MRRGRFVHVVLAFLFWLPTVGAHQRSARAVELGAAPELAKKVQAIAKEGIDSGNYVGISIGVARGDEILLAEGYGYADLEANVPATAATVYRIGSVTKQFTAAAILQLAEREKLGLDDPLTKHLPKYWAQAAPVTIRHLLHHTSGIQSFTDLPSYRRLMHDDVSHGEIIDRFKELPFHFEPGERFRYCNSGYYLLGVVLESVSETSYETFLQDQVFTPLRLENTYYDRTRRIIPNRARGYRRVEDGFENARYLSMTQPFSAGALASTVSDLIRWQRGLVDHQLLNDASYETMITKGVRTNGEKIAYGMGLFIGSSKGRMTIGHGGGINGFRSDLTYYPDSGYTIVVLANSESARPGQISKRIAQHLFAAPKPD